MKESTKTIIRIATLAICLLPYRVKRENDRRTYQSLLFECTWDKDETPALKIQRNQSMM